MVVLILRGYCDRCLPPEEVHDALRDGFALLFIAIVFIVFLIFKGTLEITTILTLRKYFLEHFIIITFFYCPDHKKIK